jgi:16S rRNA (uracil1498-N3)-methyltransferase
MKSPRIYQNIEITNKNSIELDKSACSHLVKVLRLKTNDIITLFNGDGFEYHAQINIQGKKVFAEIHTQKQTSNEPLLKISLLQGISKGDHMDITIQKAIELGVTTITPVICQRTVVNLKADRIEKKLNHWKKIIISACEQCGRNFIPELLHPVKFNDLIINDIPGLKLTLDPVSENTLHSHKPETNKVTLLIGPEGGLTQDEILLAKEKKFNGVQLGPRILRTETAALASIAALQILWGDF